MSQLAELGRRVADLDPSATQRVIASKPRPHWFWDDRPRRHQLAAVGSCRSYGPSGSTIQDSAQILVEPHLRHYLSFAHRERIRHRHHDDQTMQALCLTVATNACIMSTTSYLYDAIQAERAAGNEISNEAIAHLSPAKFAQINPFGVYNFDTTDIPARHPLKVVRPD